MTVPPMCPLLTLRDVSVRLGGRKGFLQRTVLPVQAVKQVSLDLRGGEILSLVGEVRAAGRPRSAARSSGLQRESEGEILLEGRRVSGLAPEAARRARSIVQYSHQDAGAALDPWWSIGRTLEEGLKIHGVRNASERRERVAAMLQAVGLDPTSARRYPHEFSGGQLRRLALARILLLKPRVLILDEPTSGLDMSVQATVLNLLLELRERFSLTYLFISHDLSVVERLSDRVAIMYLGRIVELGAAKTVFGHPTHPYTRTLLAAAPRLAGRRASGPSLVRGDPPNPRLGPAGMFVLRPLPDRRACLPGSDTDAATCCDRTRSCLPSCRRGRGRRLAIEQTVSIEAKRCA